MADSGDQWMREYNEAVKLSDDITDMMSERVSLPSTAPESQRLMSALRRKITILGNRLDSLESHLPRLPVKQSLSRNDIENPEDMVANLRSTAKQLASTLNMLKAGDKDSLFGLDDKHDDAVSRSAGLRNTEIVGLQGQIIKEQDEEFEKLSQTVMNTKHIALAINEEVDLHTKLIFDLDEGVEVTGSKLQQAKRKLGILNKRMGGGCSCMSQILSVVGIVVLVVVAYMLIKYL